MAVEAQIGEISVVFANTHIEAVPDIDLRMAQVSQMLDAFEGETRPVILAGDFNSRATSGTSYNHVLSKGYTDVWIDNPLTYNVNGYTFGHDSDLRNESADMRSRIDYIFAGPPYPLKQIDDIPDLIFEYELLREKGVFVLETDPKHHFESHPRFWQLRNYGQTHFHFFH